MCYSYLENVLSYIFIFDLQIFFTLNFQFHFIPNSFENTYDFETRNIDNQIFISAFKNHLKKERVNDIMLAGSRMWMCGILIFARDKTEHGRSNLSCSRFAIGFSLLRLPFVCTIVI